MTTLTAEQPKTEEIIRAEGASLDASPSEHAEGKDSRPVNGAARRIGTWYDRYAEFKVHTGYWNLARL